MSRTWILVAHSSGARLYQHDRPTRSVSLVWELASPKRQLAEVFAKDLAGRLEEGRREQRFDRLVLIVEPSFLGPLRTELSPETDARLALSVSKDLAAVPELELKEQLEELMMDVRRS
jgi:protein required for attachment to host cells